MSGAIAAAFRRTAVPLCCYYSVALGLPLLNGAAQAGAVFVQHAFVVLILPPLMVLLAAVAVHAFHSSLLPKRPEQQ